MKISVLIPSRLRHHSLQSVIGALHHLSCDKNEIQYCIGLDDDDVQSVTIMQNLPKEWNVIISMQERPGSLGSIYNRLAQENPADIYALFADDLFPLCPHWDHALTVAISQYPDRILAWNDMIQPGLPTYPIIPHSWYKDAGLFTEHFPFWFDDTWLTEVYKMATGLDIVIPQQLRIAGRKGKTERMRDMPFWWDFFARTRSVRVRQAFKISAEMQTGVDFAPLADAVVRASQNRDAYFRPRLSDMQIIGGDDKPVDACYLNIKSAAEQFILEHAL